MKQLSFLNDGRQQAANSRKSLAEHKSDESAGGYCMKDHIVTLVVRSDAPPTANEIAHKCSASHGKSPETYRKRFKELVDAGRLRECESRKCTITGKTATTYAKA